MNAFFYTCARLRARRALNIAGHSRAEVNRLIDGCDSDVIDAAVYEAAAKIALGEGSIIAAIIAFFETTQGQAIIAALVRLLLATLAV